MKQADIHVHNLLKNAREQKGMSSRQVATALHIDQALISKFENGQRLPARKQLEPLAQLLEIDQQQLQVCWLKEKIRQLILTESHGAQAIEELLHELKPDQNNTREVDILLEEMEALRERMEALRRK